MKTPRSLCDCIGNHFMCNSSTDRTSSVEKSVPLTEKAVAFDANGAPALKRR